MMHGHGESDPAIVAAKPTNKAERSAAETVEPRAEAEGNASQQSTHRAQYRVRVSQALGRVRQAANRSPCRQTPEVGADAGNPLVRICAGGVRKRTSLPRID